MKITKKFYLLVVLPFVAAVVQAQGAHSMQPATTSQGLVIPVVQPNNSFIQTLPNNQTSGIWFNNAPGHKVNCVNHAQFNGRSCTCMPPYKLNKIIETYDGATTSTVWQCRQVQDEYHASE